MLPHSTGSSLFFRLRAFPASGKLPWPTHRAVWKWQGVNIPSTLAWKIPWTEEPGGLQSMGSLRVGHDWATSLSLFTFMHWRRKWQPTPVFLPRESQGRGSLVGCRLWGRIESTRLKWLSSSNNIPKATLTQWRKKGKSPSFSIPWWDCLTPQMASEGVREALTYAPLSVSLTLPLPPASPNHLPNKQPAPKALYQFLLYIMVLFQCL